MFHHLRNLPVVGPGLGQDLELAFANVRASYLEDSLKFSAKEVLVDVLKPTDRQHERRTLGRLCDVLLALVQVSPSASSPSASGPGGMLPLA